MTGFEDQPWREDLRFIPDYMREGVEKYVMDGRETGSFLMSVFENNLIEAIGRADTTNIRCLQQYAYLLLHMPAGSFGSRENVKQWIARGGLNGIAAAESKVQP